MEKNIKSSDKESGQVVMFVIFVVLFLVLFVSLFISNTLTKQSKIAIAAANSVQAYYIADSGAENALYQISKLPDEMELDSSMDLDTSTDLLFTFYGTDVDSDAGISDLASAGGQDKIDIIGTYKKTSRAIQLFW